LTGNAGGNLYATWDTQGTSSDGSANDIGWLSVSTDHGAHWSAPLQAPTDRLNVPHIMEVAGGGSGDTPSTCGRSRRAWLALGPDPPLQRVRRSVGLAGGHRRHPDIFSAVATANLSH
jgi:hypothetical protein